jgi:hypothetical protein
MCTKFCEARFIFVRVETGRRNSEGLQGVFLAASQSNLRTLTRLAQPSPSGGTCKHNSQWAKRLCLEGSNVEILEISVDSFFPEGASLQRRKHLLVIDHDSRTKISVHICWSL